MSTAKEMDNIKAQFLYAAIADTQGTIRATDSKIAVLMLILIIPLTKLGSIYKHCFALFDSGEKWVSTTAVLLIVVFAFLWTVSFWMAVRALHPVDDPSDHIDGEKPHGVFYSGGLFAPDFWAATFKCSAISKQQIAHQLQQLPSSTEEVLKELAFEHLKLVYIRTIKSKRFGYALRGGIAWVVIGGLMWLASLYLKTQ